MKKINQEELKEKLELHEKWLNGEKEGVKLDLRNTNLTNVDLRHADLRCANLENVDLRHVDLRCANLENVDLRN